MSNSYGNYEFDGGITTGLNNENFYNTGNWLTNASAAFTPDAVHTTNYTFDTTTNIASDYGLAPEQPLVAPTGDMYSFASGITVEAYTLPDAGVGADAVASSFAALASAEVDYSSDILGLSSDIDFTDMGDWGLETGDAFAPVESDEEIVLEKQFRPDRLLKPVRNLLISEDDVSNAVDKSHKVNLALLKLPGFSFFGPQGYAKEKALAIIEAAVATKFIVEAMLEKNPQVGQLMVMGLWERAGNSYIRYLERERGRPFTADVKEILQVGTTLYSTRADSGTSFTVNQTIDAALGAAQQLPGLTPAEKAALAEMRRTFRDAYSLK